MGTWGTGIKDNDTSSGIYAKFYSQYDAGGNPYDISSNLIATHEELIHNPDNHTNFWLALALAQWETKSLDPVVLSKVKHLVETGLDLHIWKELGGDNADIAKRKQVLDKFLEKIQTVKSTPKPRTRPNTPVYQAGDCICFQLQSGHYGGAVVLAADHESNFGWNLVIPTRLQLSTKPTLKEFEEAEALVLNYGNWEDELMLSWYFPNGFNRKYAHLFERIGNLPVARKYVPNEKGLNATVSGGWHHIMEAFEKQKEHERHHPAPSRKYTIQELIKRKKFWKWW